MWPADTAGGAVSAKVSVTAGERYWLKLSCPTPTDTSHLDGGGPGKGCAVGARFHAAEAPYPTQLLLLTTHYSPLTTHHSPLTTHHSPLTTHYSLLTTHYTLRTTHDSPLTTSFSTRRPTHCGSRRARWQGAPRGPHARASATATHAAPRSMARTGRAYLRCSASQVCWAPPSASTPPPPPPQTTAAKSPRARCAPTRSARRDRASPSATRLLARRSPIGTRAAARSTAAPPRSARATPACPPRPSSKTGTGARRRRCYSYSCARTALRTELRTAYAPLTTRCGSPLYRAREIGWRCTPKLLLTTH
jgi:hypothetical protein